MRFPVSVNCYSDRSCLGFSPEDCTCPSSLQTGGTNQNGLLQSLAKDLSSGDEEDIKE